MPCGASARGSDRVLFHGQPAGRSIESPLWVESGHWIGPRWYHSARLELGDSRFGNFGEVVREEVSRAGLYPLVEVDLLELACVPGLHNLQVFYADIFD